MSKKLIFEGNPQPVIIQCFLCFSLVVNDPDALRDHRAKHKDEKVQFIRIESLVLPEKKKDVNVTNHNNGMEAGRLHK